MSVNINSSWAASFKNDAGFQPLDRTAFKNKMKPQELYTYVENKKDVIKRLKARGYSFKEIFWDAEGIPLDEHLDDLRNGKSPMELVTIAQKTPFQSSSSTPAPATSAPHPVPSIAVSNFSSASRDLLTLKDEDLEGNITIKELYKKYPDMLNKEFLKGNIDLDEYNELLAAYKLRKNEEIVPLNETSYNTKHVKIKKNPPKFLSQIAR